MLDNEIKKIRDFGGKINYLYVLIVSIVPLRFQQ